MVIETQEASLVGAAQGTVTAAVVGKNGDKGTLAIDIKERFLRLRQNKMCFENFRAPLGDNWGQHGHVKIG